MDERLRVQIRTEFDVTRATLETTRFATDAGFGETPSRMIATAGCAFLVGLVDVTAVFFGAVIFWGFAFFAEVPDGWTILGSLVIAGAGVYVWYRETYGRN